MAERAQRVVSRVELMLRWIRGNKPEIEGINKGSVTFDFSGSKLVVKVQGFEEIFKEKIGVSEGRRE